MSFQLVFFNNKSIIYLAYVYYLPRVQYPAEMCSVLVVTPLFFVTPVWRCHKEVQCFGTIKLSKTLDDVANKM